MIWNPDKFFLELGFIKLGYYNLLWVISFVFGWIILKQIFLKDGKTKAQLDTFSIYVIVGTMLGARLGHVFFYDWDYYSQNLIEILLPIRKSLHSESSILFGWIKGYEFTGFRGLASHGATIGIIIGTYLFARKFKPFKTLWLLDRLVIPVALGAFFVRLGNFFNSEINGKIVEKSYIFAVKFLQGDIHEFEAKRITGEKTAHKAYDMIATDPKFLETLDKIPYRHPAQLYEGVSYIFLFLILYFLYWKTPYKSNPGFLLGLFLIFLWTVRFFVEFVKRSQGGFEESWGLFSTGQWLSLPFIAIGWYFLVKSFRTS